jgi:[FeFe] hydrogenase H-cluster maturation GTPase HydF
MSLTNTPASERIHITFFGRTNTGKSSIINAVTSQNISIVSKIKGTTTDPVSKTMELLPLGAVVITDTAGLDDNSELGKLRIEKTLKSIDKTDIAVIVTDSDLSDCEKKLIETFTNKNIPYIICYSKSDLHPRETFSENEISVSAMTGANINKLKNLIASLKPDESKRKIVTDLVNKGDIVLLVIPIDKAAPKGRLILPQQQVMRELIENGNICISVNESQLETVVDTLKNKIKLVITDSQVFKQVAKTVPENIRLTSFSILFLRYKGDFDYAYESISTLDNLKENDNVLICEGCTHHRQCDDIGTVKLPSWIENYTNKKLNFSFTSGNDFPKDLSDYSLIIHCGACMLTKQEMKSRIEYAKKQNIPMTNYGITIAKVNGILERSVQCLDI